MEFATKTIHTSDSSQKEKIGAIMPPIYTSSTFALSEVSYMKNGFDYTRTSYSNFFILEQTLAALENGSYATVFSSGIGALTAMISTLCQGDKIILLNGVYNSTYRFFKQVTNRFGIQLINSPLSTLDEIEQLLIKEKPKWLLFETPTYPLMTLLDITKITRLTKKYSVISIVDNTFASPYCQSPLNFGADVVWHSNTKYISGHCDILGGVIITNHELLKKQFDLSRKKMGTYPSPFNCWLIIRGIKTLALRMQQHEKNALAVAKFLEHHPKVEAIFYSGLTSNIHYQLACKQMQAFNGILAVKFNMKIDQILQMLSTFHYFTLTESIGGIESVISHPTSMTYRSILTQKYKCVDISANLVCFSVGIEDTNDLIKDLEQNLENYK